MDVQRRRFLLQSGVLVSAWMLPRHLWAQSRAQVVTAEIQKQTAAADGVRNSIHALGPNPGDAETAAFLNTEASLRRALHESLRQVPFTEGLDEYVQPEWRPLKKAIDDAKLPSIPSVPEIQPGTIPAIKASSTCSETTDDVVADILLTSIGLDADLRKALVTVVTLLPDVRTSIQVLAKGLLAKDPNQQTAEIMLTIANGLLTIFTNQVVQRELQEKLGKEVWSRLTRALMARTIVVFLPYAGLAFWGARLTLGFYRNYDRLTAAARCGATTV